MNIPTDRAGNLGLAFAAGAVMFGLYVIVHRIRNRPIVMEEAQLYAVGAAASMYLLGV